MPSATSCAASAFVRFRQSAGARPFRSSWPGRRRLGGTMDTQVLLDAIGRPRSPAMLPGHLAGHPPNNKGRRYPADPPRVEEIVAVMRAAGEGVSGARMRALIVVLWRAGLRIGDA